MKSAFEVIFDLTHNQLQLKLGPKLTPISFVDSESNLFIQRNLPKTYAFQRAVLAPPNWEKVEISIYLIRVRLPDLIIETQSTQIQ